MDKTVVKRNVKRKASTSMMVCQERIPSVAFVVRQMGLSTVWLLHLMIIQKIQRWIRPMTGIIGFELLNGQNCQRKTKLLRQ